MDHCERIESLTESQKNLEWFASEKLGMDKETWLELLKQFKFIGLNSAFRKFQSYGQLLKYEEEAAFNFANKFTSVSLNPSTVSEPVVDIVHMVNILS